MCMIAINFTYSTYLSRANYFCSPLLLEKMLSLLFRAERELLPKTINKKPGSAEVTSKSETDI